MADTTYSYLVEIFGEKELKNRHQTISEILLNFIESENLQGQVAVSEQAVSQVVTDYFADIDRIKSFQEIQLVNEIKIYAYLAYWLWRRKPLQITENANAESLQFVNEEMVSSLLEGFLFQNPPNVVIVSDAQKREDFDSFIQTLRYYLKYRAVNPQCLELMIHAFIGGRAYQYSDDFRS